MYALTFTQMSLILIALKKILREEERKKIKRKLKIYNNKKNKHFEIAKPIFQPTKVTFFDEIRNGNKTSYTFVEAMILLSGYIAAHNKE